MKKLIITILLIFTVTICLSQTAKKQQGYYPPYEPDDEKQHLINLDIADKFMLKRLPVTPQKPGDEMLRESPAVQDDGTNIILWFKRSNGEIWGIELSSAPLTTDQ